MSDDIKKDFDNLVKMMKEHDDVLEVEYEDRSSFFTTYRKFRVRMRSLKDMALGGEGGKSIGFKPRKTKHSQTEIKIIGG